jgi:RNA polymerase sigma-70 factor (ECF subfamily)
MSGRPSARRSTMTRRAPRAAARPRTEQGAMGDTVEQRQVGEDRAALAAIHSGDEAAFGALAARHRRELHVHCYRMLGSFDEAEEHTQEVFLRAWRSRDRFEGRATFRAWLYRIATNACLDTLRSRPERRPRRGRAGRPTPTDLPWLQPYPDGLLDEAAPSAEQPDVLVAAEDTIGLAFLATIQLLPPRQRAVLILRDVLDWSANDTAQVLETSVASVNSAVQRARATLRRHRPPPGEPWAPLATPTLDERELLRRYVEAHHRGDSAAMVALLRHDIRISMPPDTLRLEGDVEAARFFAEIFDPAQGLEFRLLPTRVNRQPAAANYLREAGQDAFRAFSLDVLRVQGGAIVEITTFFVPGMFPLLGLPPSL